MRKVAIVAFSPRSREEAPFDDPSFEIWGMNNLHVVLPDRRFTRWYEIHPPDFLSVNNKYLSSDHIAWLKTMAIPVYMLRQYEEFPTSLAYPIEDVQDMMRNQLGFPPNEDHYLKSTPAMALAHALLEGVDHVEIYGCDMVVDAEYGYQRSNMEAWIALARQQPALSGGKVTVKVSDNCALMKGLGVYGFEEKSFSFTIRLEEQLKGLLIEAEQRKKSADDERVKKQIEMNTFDGARQAIEQVLTLVTQMRRGYVS